jgi:hypothetical protein
MSNNTAKRPETQDQPSSSQQVLKWAMCHPGVLLLGSLAVGAMLAPRSKSDQPLPTGRRVETEADIIDGDVPLFI